VAGCSACTGVGRMDRAGREWRRVHPQLLCRFFGTVLGAGELRTNRPGKLGKWAAAGVRAASFTSGLDLLMRPHVGLRCLRVQLGSGNLPLVPLGESLVHSSTVQHPGGPVRRSAGMGSSRAIAASPSPELNGVWRSRGFSPELRLAGARGYKHDQRSNLAVQPGASGWPLSFCAMCPYRALNCELGFRCGNSEIRRVSLADRPGIQVWYFPPMKRIHVPSEMTISGPRPMKACFTSSSAMLANAGGGGGSTTLRFYGNRPGSRNSTEPWRC